MEHPKVDDIKKNIVSWVEENLTKTLLPFHSEKGSFKFGRVSTITKVWAENDYWLVDAAIEYNLGQSEMRTVTFQVNKEGEIIGYDLHEPRAIGRTTTYF